MLIFELSGINEIWVTNLDEEKKFFTLIIKIFFFGRGNNGTQVLKGRNVAKTFENHCLMHKVVREEKRLKNTVLYNFSVTFWKLRCESSKSITLQALKVRETVL